MTSPSECLLRLTFPSITDQKAPDRLVTAYDRTVTTHKWATGFRWAIIRSARTPIEAHSGAPSTMPHRRNLVLPVVLRCDAPAQILAVQQIIAKLAGRQTKSNYTGAAELQVDAVVERAMQYVKDRP